MKRFLTIAALAVGLFTFAGTTDANAGDYFHGGHHGYGGAHHRGYSHNRGQAYPNYGYSSHYGSYGYGRTYQPRYRQRYAPTHRAPSRRQHGGLHVDIGRFHVLGSGGHHH